MEYNDNAGIRLRLRHVRFWEGEVWSNSQDEFRFIADVAAIGGISVGRYAWMEKLRCDVSIWGCRWISLAEHWMSYSTHLMDMHDND